MDLGLSGILMLGLVIGLQHALEADHVAAVSSMVSGETSVKRIVWHGALWGSGHALMLAAVVGTIIYLGAALNEQIMGWLEFVVWRDVGCAWGAMFYGVSFANVSISTHINMTMACCTSMRTVIAG